MEAPMRPFKGRFPWGLALWWVALIISLGCLIGVIVAEYSLAH